MSKNRKQYRLRFLPLTPIHIGTGDEIDPLEYVMKAKPDGGKRLYRLNLPAMIESFTPSKREEFLRILDGGDMMRLRDFVKRNADVSQHGFYNAVTTDSVYYTYEKSHSNPNNALRINPTYRRLDTWQAVVPGSSIKGAIRTAVLSHKLRIDYERGGRLPDERNLEKDVFHAPLPNDDPFRTVHIEDVTLPEDAVIVAETEIISQRTANNDSTTEGIQMFYEMTFAHLMQEEIAGTGSLILLPGLQREYNKLNENQNTMLKIDAETIVAHCKEFYCSWMKEEHKKFYEKRKNEEVYTVSKQLLDISYGNLEFPIRLGHFSHCESVTVDLILNPADTVRKQRKEFRNPKTRTVNGRSLPYGTTRTLAFGEFPMGWAKISLEEMG